MSRKVLFTTFAILSLALAGAAMAQSGGGTDPGAATQVQQQTPPQETPPATPPATPADDVTKSIREKGAKLSEKTSKSVDAKLDVTEKSVDAAAAKSGDQTVADRLAKEFGTTPDVMMQEKSQFNVGWGQLVVANTLMANAKTPVTLQQLFDMRNSGMGWGQIANGMGLKLGEVISASKAEASVANGHTKPDGKVATIHGASSHGTGAADAMGRSHAHGAMGGDAAKMGGKAGK
jgi:hypothetical protein